MPHPPVPRLSRAWRARARAAAQPCLLTTLFSALLVAYNLLAQQRGWALAATALTPHTLLGSALSLLLVFRTNASFARMVEARQARPPRGRPPRLGRRRRAAWPGRGAACACRVPVVGEA